MKVNKKFRYGLRAMIEVAACYDSGPLSAKSISKCESIPLQYLEQIFNTLKRAGLVKTVRGPKGGYLLSRKPSRIKVSHIMSALDTGMRLTDCIVPKKQAPCARLEGCPAAKFWQKLHKSIKATAESINLEDLAVKKAKIADIKHNYMFQI